MSRQMVYGDKTPPAKIKTLLDDPLYCSRVASAWEVIKTGIIAIQSDLAGFTTPHALEAGPTVLACNKILTTFEVIKDQAIFDRQNAENP